MAERHPVRERPDLPLERQVEVLRELVAQLWDQVWWLTLPPDRRAGYEAEGFTAPIQQWYEEIPEAPDGTEVPEVTADPTPEG